MKLNRFFYIMIIIVLSLALFTTGCIKMGNEINTTTQEKGTQAENEEPSIDESGEYTSKDEVSLYIHTYNKLPSNYITKAKARELGWDAQKGNLWEVAKGKSIGGDKFGNREGSLPKADKRQYYECDINYEGGFRGPERLVYSNDGLIYYTKDHYDSFEQLYGED